MTIWVDADAVPNLIRDMLYKAARRTGTELTLVANQYIQTPRDANITSIQVPQGFDVADNEIVQRVKTNDLVITGDIPLAGQKLNLRDFMDSMRSSGVQTGGPPPMNAGDRQQFANHLDRYLTKYS